MFLHGRFRQSARNGYVIYVPSHVILKFNWNRICGGEYVLTDIFDLQRHLSRVELTQLCHILNYRILSWGNGKHT